MKKIHLGIQLVPLEHGRQSWQLIDRFIEHIRSTGNRFEVSPLETIIECSFEEGMNMIRWCYDLMESEFKGDYLLYTRMHAHTLATVSWNEKTLHRKS